MKVFSFEESRHYLKAYIERLPKGGRGEVSRLAKHLRVSSTLVSQILAGKKLLTPEQAAELSAYLGFTALEAEYWNYLVQMERAGTAALIAFWKKRLLAIRSRSQKLIHHLKVDRELNDEERAIFYSTHIYSAARLFASTGKAGRTLEEISERFGLSRAKAAEVMGFLAQAGLCVERSGRYQMGIQKTHLGQGSPFLPRLHTNWRLQALRRSEDLTDEELMFTSPVSLSRKDFARLRSEMTEFVARFLEQVHASPAEEVACLNLDFFWVRK